MELIAKIKSNSVAPASRSRPHPPFGHLLPEGEGNSKRPNPSHKWES